MTSKRLPRINPSWFRVRPWTKHSQILMAGGWGLIATGIGYLYIIPGGPRWEALVVARKLMPIDAWALVWVLVGLLAIISSRWPPASEKWGYMVLTGHCSAWSAFHLVGLPFIDEWQSSFISVVVWGLLAFLWWAIGGLNNPPDSDGVSRHGD